MSRSNVAIGLIAAALLGHGNVSSDAFAAPKAQDDAVTYVVRKGDTLYGLTTTYLVGTSALAELQAVNRVAIPRRLPVGFRLTIPRRLLRFDPIELRLTTFSGPVSVIHAGKPQPAGKGEVLVEGDVTETGANGFALFIGSEGSRIAIPSNSKVRFERARRYRLTAASDILIEIGKGQARIEAAKQVPNGQFRVKTPVATSAVRGTVFRAGFDAAAIVSATEVLEGEVGVAAARNDVAVPAGFGAAANASGEVAKESLLPAPALLDPGKVQTEEAATFALKPVDGARGYRLQVARDAGIEDIVAEGASDAPSASFPNLRNGTFFLRASAISRSGLQGQDEIWSFRRQRVGIAADMGQAAIPGAIRINWHAEGEGAALFRFQLFGDDIGNGKDALPLIDEAGLTQPGMTLTGLKRGVYRWRIGVRMTTAEGSAEAWSPLQKFTVSN